jgi:hypothetical protein
LKASQFRVDRSSFRDTRSSNSMPDFRPFVFSDAKEYLKNQFEARTHFGQHRGRANEERGQIAHAKPTPRLLGYFADRPRPGLASRIAAKEILFDI